MKRLLLVLAGLGLTWAMVPSAFADVFSFYMTVDEAGGTAPPADAVLVTVNRTDATDATVTFQGETIGPNTYYMSDVYFNVDGDFTLGTVTGTQPAYTSMVSQNIDTFGAMSEHLSPVPHKPSSIIVISLAAAGGNQWDNAFDVLTRTCPDNNSVPSCVGGYGVTNPDGGGGYNPGSYTHGFDVEATVGTSSSSAVTGGPTTDLAGFEVPEPASLLLFGSLVLGLATFVRRKSSAN